MLKNLNAVYSNIGVPKSCMHCKTGIYNSQHRMIANNFSISLGEESAKCTRIDIRMEVIPGGAYSPGPESSRRLYSGMLATFSCTIASLQTNCMD